MIRIYVGLFHRYPNFAGVIGVLRVVGRINFDFRPVRVFIAALNEKLLDYFGISVHERLGHFAFRGENGVLRGGQVDNFESVLDGFSAIFRCDRVGERIAVFSFCRKTYTEKSFKNGVFGNVSANLLGVTLFFSFFPKFRNRHRSHFVLLQKAFFSANEFHFA